MIVSEARRPANRHGLARNLTEAKARLKASALKHGTTIDDVQAFPNWVAEWHAVLKPVGPTQEWFADEVAKITLKIDHAGKVDRTLRDGLALRAETCWDLVRRFEAETLARDISKRPAEIVIGLRRTVQGCDLLIERWAMLAQVADQNGHWDEGQIKMAFDLLGTPPEVRGANPCLHLDDDGRIINDPAGPAGFARLQLEAIRSSRATIEPLDEFDRESTINDLTDAPSPDYRRFRRYETALQNRLKWCLNQIKADRAAVAPPKPKPVAPPPPVVQPPEIEDDYDDIDDEPTDEELVAWFRAEATKAGFDDIDALLPDRAQRDQLRLAARRDIEEEDLARRRS